MQARRVIRRVVHSIEETWPSEGREKLTPRQWSRDLQDAAKLSKALCEALAKLVDAEQQYGWYIRPSPLASNQAANRADQALRRSGIEEACRGLPLPQAPLVQHLLALQEYCRAVPMLLPVDRGRGKSFERRSSGPPALRIIIEAAFLFYDMGPSELTGTLEGPFYKFAASFYELIAPDGPDGDLPSATDQGVRLIQNVWHVAPHVKQLRQTQNLILAMINNPGLLKPGGASLQTLFHKRDQLREKLMNGPAAGR